MGIGKFWGRDKRATAEVVLADVYPLLKPEDWEFAELVPQARIGAPGEQLIIAYTRDAGDRYELITVDDPEAGDGETLHHWAMHNLAELKYEWKVGEFQPGLIVANASGEDFSAEKLLDPAMLRKAHELLDSEEIIVAAPRRRCLYAFPSSVLDDQEAARAMTKLVYLTFVDDSYGNAEISPILWVMRDGEPVGRVRTGA